MRKTHRAIIYKCKNIIYFVNSRYLIGIISRFSTDDQFSIHQVSFPLTFFKMAIFETRKYNYILFSLSRVFCLAHSERSRQILCIRACLVARIKYLSRRRNLQRVTPLRYEFVESRRSAIEHKGCRSNEVLELARGRT